MSQFVLNSEVDKIFFATKTLRHQKGTKGIHWVNFVRFSDMEIRNYILLIPSTFSPNTI